MQIQKGNIQQLCNNSINFSQVLSYWWNLLSTAVYGMVLGTLASTVAWINSVLPEPLKRVLLEILKILQGSLWRPILCSSSCFRIFGFLVLWTCWPRWRTLPNSVHVNTFFHKYEYLCANEYKFDVREMTHRGWSRHTLVLSNESRSD